MRSRFVAESCSTKSSASACCRLLAVMSVMVSTTWTCPEAGSTLAHWIKTCSSFGRGTSLVMGAPDSTVFGIWQNEQGVAQCAMFW